MFSSARYHGHSAADAGGVAKSDIRSHQIAVKQLSESDVARVIGAEYVTKRPDAIEHSDQRVSHDSKTSPGDESLFGALDRKLSRGCEATKRAGDLSIDEMGNVNRFAG